MSLFQLRREEVWCAVTLQPFVTLGLGMGVKGKKKGVQELFGGGGGGGGGNTGRKRHSTLIL